MRLAVFRVGSQTGDPGFQAAGRGRPLIRGALPRGITDRFDEGLPAGAQLPPGLGLSRARCAPRRAGSCWRSTAPGAGRGPAGEFGAIGSLLGTGGAGVALLAPPRERVGDNALTGGVLLEAAGGSGHRLGLKGEFGDLALVVSRAPAVRTSPRPKGLESAG
ncbi:hypothetical protein [Streptomyces rimosus]|uniref:hypothetical protein n=1 Tax=Streptomyces rimosus TaxID=1927 RepID=UPI00131B9607|nr:hypothetical protein [Streptomyces rimosus]